MTAPETAPAAAPEAPRRIPFVTDAWRLVRVLFEPTAVFEELRPSPTFWIPWIVVSVAMLIVTMLSFPFTLEAAGLAASERGQPLPASAEAIMRFSALVAVPLVMLVILLILAGVMYLALLPSGGDVRYKGLMSVAVATGFLGVLQLLLTYVVLKLRGPEGLQSIADFQVSFGLDLLLPQDASLPRALEGMLKAVTPFSIWGLALTAIGIRVVEKTSKGAAWTAASVSFVLGLAFAAVGGMFGGGPR